MTDRTTKVTLIAQAAGFVSGMDQAANATKRTAAETKQLAEQQAALKQTTRDVGVALVAFGAIAAAAVAMSVSKFAQFDKAMSGVHAATQEGTVGMGALRDAALEAGNSTQYSATAAADAITQLGKAGLDTQDILSGGLSASLNLAASDNLDLATAAGIAATAMQQFGLEGKDLGHVSDLLAAGANKALGGVEDLANGLKFVGPVAAGMGVSIDETTAALAAFASQGILGEQAGTGLRGVLSSLTSPSAMAQKELERLGVTLYDSTGRFLGLTNMAGELSNAYKGLDDSQRDMSLGMIFGNMQVTAARVLYQQGAEGMREWTEAVNDQGFAAKVAAQQLDNLEGDVTKLGNAFDTAMIQSGSGANDALRSLTQTATGLVRTFSEAPPALQSTALVLGGITAAAALAGGGLLLLLPKIHQTRLAMQALNITGGSLVKTLGKTAGLAAVASVLTVALSHAADQGELTEEQLAKLQAALNTGDASNFVAEIEKTSGGMHSLQQNVDRLTAGGLEGFQRDWNRTIQNMVLGTLSFIPALKDLQDGANQAESEFREFGTMLGALARTDLPSATDQFNQLVKANGGGKDAVEELLKVMPGYKAALIEVAGESGKVLTEQELLSFAQGKGALATKLAEDAARKNAVKLGDMGAAASDATGMVNNLSDALDGFNDVQFTADDAISAFRQSVLDVTTAMGAEGFTGTLDESTQEGIDNNRMLRALAEDANTAAAKVLNLTGEQADANAVLEDARARLEEVGGAFGLSGDALQTFIDKYVASPKEIEYQAGVLGITEMNAELDAFFHRWNGATINLRATGSAQLGSGILRRAEGGILPGVPSRSDNMLIAAASGEFLTNSVATAKNRSALEYINRGGVIRGYASGGEIGRPAYAPAPVYAPPAPQYMQGPSMVEAFSSLLTGTGNGPVVIARESVDALADAVARRTRVLDRQGVA